MKSKKSDLEVLNNNNDHRNPVDFNDIVDKDKCFEEEHSSQIFVGILIESLPFRIVILLAIIMNSIVIGLQTNKRLEAEYGAVLLGLDIFFLTLFALEILIKWYHDFLGFWKVGWNIFDFLIIASSFFIPGIGFLGSSRILHVLRVLHATRSLRSISTLQGLQTVIQTVIYSIPDMANVMALLLICIFIFAILGNSIFGDDCPQHFGSVEITMFSLFICVTQDGWLSIVQELNSCGKDILGPIYLVIFITVGAFVFANLVVAVVVTNLEWVIAEKNEIEKKFNVNKQDDAHEMPTLLSAYEGIFKIAHTQIPLKLNPNSLGKYQILLTTLEENFTEFRRIKDELFKIQQELQALETLDEVSNEELLELSNMMGNVHDLKSQPHMQKKPSKPNVVTPAGAGDAMSEMLGMLRKSSLQTGHAKSIQHMMSQLLIQPEPPAESAGGHRFSLSVNTAPSEHTTLRRHSQMALSDPSTSDVNRLHRHSKELPTISNSGSNLLRHATKDHRSHSEQFISAHGRRHSLSSLSKLTNKKK